ncbi:hypothetical protein Hbl1158_10915 [Halobaculum sp. CBA1158]|uniref:DUF7504 family protein n=1 Tax=Halobaculum sp. CBA1158 TaxID=2904243 RepID=UPI001F243554|nr:hypothetical protein [Halobaculum sp. CBA1158]UIO99042.1 hypothetical protein Hbl1158_10915 [Halobaculum sp. CBA1158]
MNGITGHRGERSELTRGSPSTLSAALARLDDGCCVLVTGDVPDDAYQLAASRYFGEPDRERRRVLALTRGANDDDAWLPDGVDAADDDAAVIHVDDPARDPTDVRPGSADPDSVDLDDSDDTSADELRERLFDAVDRFADADGRLELRVGVYRVDTLCATLGSDTTRELLRDLASETRDRGGMAHLHLPRSSGDRPRDDPVVDDVAAALGEHLDVIVELRCRERASGPEERWHILGWGRTEWNSLR